MKYLHDNNIIHRDLKPGNVLLNKNFEPQITDFGLSKFFNSNDSKNQSNAVGTPMYMAPEIIRDDKYGRKADVYAFGILMYEVVTDLIPYPDFVRKNINFYNFSQRVVNENYRPKFANQFKEPLKKLIEKCWSSDENERPTFSDIFEKVSNINKQYESQYFLDGVDVDKINWYVESITKIDDRNKESNHQQELIGMQNEQLTINNNKDVSENQSLESENEKLKSDKMNLENDIKKIQSEIQQLKKGVGQLKTEKNSTNDQNNKNEVDDDNDETVIIKSSNNVNYKLSFHNLTAEVIESQEAKGDILIPTFVDFQVKKFRITRICDGAFKNSSINSVSFAQNSQVQTIGDFAFKNSTISKLYIPASLSNLNEKFAEEANELKEIEVDENNIYFSNESGFLISLRQKDETSNNKTNEILFAPKEFNGEFLIPEKVTCLGYSAFIRRSKILSIKSESPSFKQIKSFCFYQCKNLTKAIFKGQTDLFLDDFCFSESKKLSSIEISSKTITIGRNCFDNCTSLSSINFDKTDTIKLGQQSFKGCRNLKDITIFNASLIEIGDECFSDAINLNSLRFITSSIIFGNDFIKNCPLLTFITIENKEDLIISSNTFGNNNLQYINLVTESTLRLDDSCFKNSKNVENIDLSFEKIVVHTNCFSECSSLLCITLKSKNEIVITNEFFNECESLEILVLSSKSNIFISDKFMNGSEKLKSVKINGVFICIGSNCFNNCQSLLHFSISKSIQVELKEGQFINCKNLETIFIESKIINIYQKQICNYKSLKCFIIQSDSQIFLRNNCFNGFVSLENVLVSGENIIIEDNCFKDCSNLNKLHFHKAENITFGSTVFYNCSKLIKIDIKVNSELKFDHDCFYGSSIKKSILEGKIVDLGQSCFENHLMCLSTIDSIYINSEKVVINDYCFRSCSLLESISISSKDVEIKSSAFENCCNLKSIFIFANDAQFGISAFEECINLEVVTLYVKNNINILDNCFANSKNLKIFDFSCKEAKFGVKCFFGCFSLKSFLNQNTDQIIFLMHAFDYCNNLENIEITAKSEFEAGNYCFDRLPNLKKVVINCPKVKIGDFCFNNCSSLATLSFPTVKEMTYYTSYNLECYNAKIFINPKSIKNEIRSERIENNRQFISHTYDP